MDLNTLRYAPTHEWAALDGDTVTVGITTHAVTELGDLTYLELKKVGARFKAGDEIGVVESYKAASPLYAPVAGEIVAVNDKVLSDNATVNADPHGAGWLVKMKVESPAALDHLLTKTQYDAQLAGH